MYTLTNNLSMKMKLSLNLQNRSRRLVSLHQLSSSYLITLKYKAQIQTSVHSNPFKTPFVNLDHTEDVGKIIQGSDKYLLPLICLSSLCIHQIYLTVFHSLTKQLYNSNLHLRVRYKIQATIMKLLLCIYIYNNNICIF